MSFPAKKMQTEIASPPQSRPKPTCFRCETCGKGLDKQYVCDAKDPLNPNDDTRRCFGCAGTELIAKRPIPVDWRLIYGFGVVTWPVLVYGIPLLWRLLRG